MENWTEVHTPDGHKGSLLITRRERNLVDKDNSRSVKVEGTDGLIRNFTYDQLTEVIEEPDVDVCPYCNQ